MKLLLHACCGPCSLEPTRIFAEEGMELAIDYTNPNIHPSEEYARRRETLREFVADPRGLELFEGEYDPEAWEERVAVHGADRESRCRACYRLRLERVAARAAELGFDAVGTTLTISPYQFTDIIAEELDRAASAHGVAAVFRDFRDRYAQATRTSREKGMYRQNYCGCRFSIAEAAQDRARVQEQRERERHARRRALVWAAAEGCADQASRL